MTITHVQLIAAAFSELEDRGIIARPNYECCTSCGCAAMAEELANQPGTGPAIGGVFFHEQDTEAANKGGSLYLNHGTLGDTEQENQRIAGIVVEVLSKHGIEVDWDGDLSRKMQLRIPGQGWNLRYPWKPGH